MNELTKDYLIDILDYDEKTGIFRWKSNRGAVNKGDIAGKYMRAGYSSIYILGKNYYLHRLAWLYVYGNWPENHIDHINRNKSDNRIENLREVTRSDNMKNRKMGRNNKSGVTGVNWSNQDRKWRSQIKSNGALIYLGLFDAFNDAVIARKMAEYKYNFHPNHGV